MSSINAFPAVVAADPGIRTHLDLPFVLPPALFRPVSAGSGEGSPNQKSGLVLA
jgi:hypothetical protein